MNDRMKLPPVGVPDIRELAQQHAQQKMQAVNNRAQAAFALLGTLIPMEKQTPTLPRCRELVNLSFQTFDYFNEQAVKILKDEAGPKIAKE